MHPTALEDRTDIPSKAQGRLAHLSRAGRPTPTIIHSKMTEFLGFYALLCHVTHCTCRHYYINSVPLHAKWDLVNFTNANSLMC